MNWKVLYDGKEIAYELTDKGLSVVIPEALEDAYLEIQTIRESYDPDEYILMPAAVYSGNRFDALTKDYPPMFTPEEAKVDMPISITQGVPRLEKDGTGKLSVTTGDLSIPCVGIWDKKLSKGYLIYTVGKIKGEDLGFSYATGMMSILVPRNRNDSTPRKYGHDAGLTFAAGEKIEIPITTFDFDCDRISCLMAHFFENRKCMKLPCELAEPQNWFEMFKIQEEKFNTCNYSEDFQTYLVGVLDETTVLEYRRYQIWQPGWTGGAISSYPLMKLGDAVSYERGMNTLKYLFGTQKESGFFVGIIDIDGTEYSDGFNMPGTETWHLVRKSADVLYFLFKHFKVIEEKGEQIPTEFLEGTKRLAAAFVKLWKTYGQFGQFVSHETGEITVGGSSSATIAPAGLVMASIWFEDSDLMNIARESAQYYYDYYLQFGCTTGGPGDMLSCPDSESAFGLLESMIVLYENTKEDIWLTYAKDVANYCSTWVVGYNYEFPVNSEFSRLGIKTVGSVFANLQNKHSAPGICTLSGDSLYKLYLYTGENKYLEMIGEIAHNIFQYLSTEDKPIRAKDGSTYRTMPKGYMNERVNTSDWEEGRVGEIFYGSTWAETSCMLTIAELNNLVATQDKKDFLLNK